MTTMERERRPAIQHPHALPTVAELRSMSDAELLRRHDALVTRARQTGEPVSDVYLGELGRRMAELRLERALKVTFAALLVSFLALAAALLVLILAA